jgi:hypothetical protein
MTSISPRIPIESTADRRVKKRFELRGRDVDKLHRRVADFLAAVRTRGGDVLITSWSADGRGDVRASILYQVPLETTASR